MGHVFKILICITLLPALCSGVRGQWVQTNGPYGGSITINCFAGSGSNIFLGTFAFGVFRSTDGGTNWTTVSNGLTYSYDIYALAVKDNYVFAATDSGVYRSTDDGSHWTRVNNDSSGLRFGLGGKYINTFAVKGNILFVGTNGSGIFRSTDDGASWTAVNNGLTRKYINALCIKDNSLYAGTEQGIFRSNDDGSNWTEVGDYTSSNSHICSFLVSGGRIFAGTKGNGVLRSIDSGEHWMIVDKGLTNDTIYSLTINDSNLFAGTDGDGIFRSSDSGAHWVLSNRGIMFPAYISAFLANASDLFAGTRDGLFRSTDGGETWTIVTNGLMYPTISALAVSGSNLFAGTYYGDGIFRSTDDGLHWSQCFTSYHGYNVSAIVASDSNIFAGSDRGIDRSTDNGEHWMSLDSAPGVSSLAISGSNLFAAGHYIYRSTDEGLHWIDANNGLDHIYDYFAIVIKGADLYAGTTGGIFHSTNEGANWVKIKNGWDYTNTFTFAVMGNYIFAGTDSGLFRSSDDGSSWMNINNSLTIRYSYEYCPYDLIVSDTVLFAIDGCDGILRSTDYGLSWNTVNDGLEHWEFPYMYRISKIIAVGPSNLFIGSDSRGVWRRPLSDFSSVAEKQTQPGLNFSLSPNPNNGTGNISYRLSTSSHVTIEIFDILGRKVETLIDHFESEGDQTERFDLSDQPAGTYYVILRTNDGSVMRSLSIIK